MLGFQSYAQLEDIYGVKGAATLFDVLNTRAFFRSPSKQIAEFAAGEIGEKEIQKASEQYSYGADPVRDGVSVGKDMERITLVSYSDIQTLPDLTCYVTLPGPYPAVKVPLKYQPRPKIAQAFIQRNIDSEAESRLCAALAAREEEGRSVSVLFTRDEPEVETVAELQTYAPVPVSATGDPDNTVKAPSAAVKEAATAASGGGVEPVLEEKNGKILPPGIDGEGEIIDAQAYERWQANTRRTMQRDEAINIHHSQRSRDDVEVGDSF